MSVLAARKRRLGELACNIKGKEEILVSMKSTTLKVQWISLPRAINEGSTQTCIGRWVAGNPAFPETDQ